MILNLKIPAGAGELMPNFLKVPDKVFMIFKKMILNLKIPAGAGELMPNFLNKKTGKITMT